MELITARSNGLIVETAKLKDKKYRDTMHEFLFEGIKLTDEAIASGVQLTRIFLTERCAERYPHLANRPEAVLISEQVCGKLSENNSPEGIICRGRYIDRLHGNACNMTGDELKTGCLILSSVRDPGNLGTIIRTSAAFGKKTVVVSKDCADLYNQKTVRASMGALFRVSVYVADDLCAAIEGIKKTGRDVYATALTDKAFPLNAVKEPSECCFVMGNEGHGLSDEVIKSCSGTVIIPMEKDAESLNVASAASVILWEAYR